MNYRCLELVNRTDARILEFRHPLDHGSAATTPFVEGFNPSADLVFAL
jgi:hypothetical protein